MMIQPSVNWKTEFTRYSTAKNDLFRKKKKKKGLQSRSCRHGKPHCVPSDKDGEGIYRKEKEVKGKGSYNERALL